MASSRRAQQVEQALRELLTDSSPGDRLPGEAELAAKLGTSRGTVREALQRMWLSGTVIRRWGAGTFVAEASTIPTAGSIYVGIDPVGSLPRRLTNAGHKVSVANFALTNPATWPTWFKGSQLPSPPLLVERALCIDGTPAIYLRDFVPESLGLTAAQLARLNDPVFDLPSMLRSVGARIVKDEATLHGHVVDEDIAEVLDIPIGGAVLSHWQRSISETGDIVSCAEAFYHPTAFTATIVRTVSE